MEPLHTKKPLTDYTEAELILLLDHNQEIEMNKMGAISSEILRRMSLKCDIFNLNCGSEI